MLTLSPSACPICAFHHWWKLFNNRDQLGKALSTFRPRCDKVYSCMQWCDFPWQAEHLFTGSVQHRKGLCYHKQHFGFFSFTVWWKLKNSMHANEGHEYFVYFALFQSSKYQYSLKWLHGLLSGTLYPEWQEAKGTWAWSDLLKSSIVPFCSLRERRAS